MKKRIDLAFNILGGLATLLVVFFVITSVMSQFQKKTAAANGTQVPVSSPQSNERLLAFTSRQGSNHEIYTVRADGSDERNITNNPAYDANPFWSPDGKRIAFQSDRNNEGYYSQIFLMNADGSNVVVLTADKGDHQLPLNTDGNTNPWSPDGSKLLYLRKGLSEAEWILQYIDINTGEIISLVNGKFSFNDISWSPDGNHIGFVFNTSPDSDKFVPQFHIVSADGTNLVNISNLLPANEKFGIYSNVNNHAWSRDGQSFFFVASDVTAENQNSENHIWKVYKVGMDGTLTIQTSTRSPIGGFWEGTYFITPFGSSGWTWVYPDGSTNTINPTKECEQERLYHPEDNSYTSAFANFSQSPNGNGIIIATCPDGNLHLSWVNSTGTQVSPIAKLSTTPDAIYADWALWSRDDKFFTFHASLPNTNDVETYIVNIIDALKNPSLPLVKISLGKSESGFIFPPAWQPILTNNIVEEKPTPEPTQPEGLIAYVNDKIDDAKIYTMRADGSNPTNLTNHSGRDVNPIWSPDGRQILFESNRTTGFSQIYSMNVDGSNLTQLTDEKVDHAIGTQYGHTPEPWSPDGKQIVYSQSVSKEEGTNSLYIMDADGNNKITLTSEPGIYTFLGWSPDGKKIVYQNQQFEGRIRIVDNDGTNYIDGPFFEGDLDRKYSQIHWETPEQFIVLGSNSEQSTWGLWNITRFFTTGDDTKYNGSSPILATSNSPIVAVFDKTYIVEDQNSLTWFTYNGAPIPLSPWDFSKLCNSTDPLVEETFHFLSPDKQHDFVGLLCPDGNNYFFLMNTDGTEIHQLGKPLAKPLQVNAMEWSPDGSYVIATIMNINNENTELYRFDIQDMLNALSTPQIQLTTDGTYKWGAAWQPQP